jgi:peptidyl-prolyl cis-trans isomerase C
MAVSLPLYWRGFAAAALLLVSFQAAGAAVQEQAAPDALGVRPPNETEVKTVKALLAELDRDPDTVVADIGPRSVTRADVAAAIRAMPAFLASRPALEVYQDGVGMAMQQTILAVRALAAGLDKQPSVAYRLRNAAEDVLADTYLRGTLAANITDDVLRRAYDRLVAGKPGPDEVDARIIVTGTAAAGEIALSRIRAGAAFNTVAQTDSLDGSAANGGDLGYVKADMLSPELAAVLFSMPVGATTPHPVQSGDHWFVLKVEGRRVAPTPTFDEARPMLTHDLAMVEVARIKQKMVADAKVVYRDALAEPAPQGAGK